MIRLRFPNVLLTALLASALFTPAFAAEPGAAAPAAAPAGPAQPPATVVLRVVVVNPSATKTQTKEVHVTLPKEIISPKFVIDNGGLTLDYDKDASLFYVHKDVELAPGETKTFEVIMEDVWMVGEDTLSQLKTHTERMMEKLVDSEYKDEAEPLSKRIFERLEMIRVTQSDTTVTKDQHISQYRDNVNTLALVRSDVEQLEKLLTVLSKQSDASKLNEFIKLKDNEARTRQRLSQKTWMVIILVLLFLGILGATFYFTWQKQAKIQENIFTRERDAFFSDKPGAPDEKKGP